MVLSINMEKALHKIQHPLMMKTINKQGIGNFLNLKVSSAWDEPGPAVP